MSDEIKVGNPTRWTTEKPDGRVRWLRRTTADDLVLQQYWSITTYEGERVVVGVHGEWRDVPIEEADER